MTMGDDTSFSISGIAEDNEFFKKMLTLIPSHSLILNQADEHPQKDITETIETPAHPPLTKDKQLKDKKQRKKEKRKLNLLTPPNLNGETASKKACSDYTNILPKSVKLVANPVAWSSDQTSSASIIEIDDKRARLRAKIEELQAKRKLNDKERQEKKRLKRRESKIKLKQRRKNEKLNADQPNNQSKLMNSVQGNKVPAKPIYNKEGQLVFSKFDFTDSSKKEKKQSDLTGKDYKRLLEKIEKRNEKISKVKSKDENAGKRLQDRYKWESVMHKAEGEKVKDNPEMLKKALKKKEKLREVKKKKWVDRTEHVQKLKDDKQAKRSENLKKRKQANKDKKLKKAKKKGRIIPGF